MNGWYSFLSNVLGSTSRDSTGISFASSLCSSVIYPCLTIKLRTTPRLWVASSILLYGLYEVGALKIPASKAASGKDKSETDLPKYDLLACSTPYDQLPKYGPLT